MVWTEKKQKTLRRGGKNTQKNCTKKIFKNNNNNNNNKKDLHDPENHDGMITHLEPDILKCEVKWALGSVVMNKASGGDAIPVELFPILKTGNAKECSNYHTTALISHTSKVMLKILQARLQQYVNHELLDV